jgi:carbonyl reductase 1
VRQLALKYPSSAFNNGKLLVYLTARDKSKGEAALADILADAKLKEAKALTQDGGLTDVKYAELDVDSTDSIRKFAAMLKSEHPEGIDFVINNAGIALNGFGQSFMSLFNILMVD